MSPRSRQRGYFRLPTLRDALDDADIALGAVAEQLERLLVRGAVVRRRGLVHAVELDHHHALVQPGLVGLRRRATNDELPTRGLDCRAGELGVRRQRVGILDRAVGRYPVGFGHRFLLRRGEWGMGNRKGFSHFPFSISYFRLSSAIQVEVANATSPPCGSVR